MRIPGAHATWRRAEPVRANGLTERPGPEGCGRCRLLPGGGLRGGRACTAVSTNLVLVAYREGAIQGWNQGGSRGTAPSLPARGGRALLVYLYEKPGEGPGWPRREAAYRLTEVGGCKS